MGLLLLLLIITCMPIIRSPRVVEVLVWWCSSFVPILISAKRKEKK